MTSSNIRKLYLAKYRNKSRTDKGQDFKLSVYMPNNNSLLDAKFCLEWSKNVIAQCHTSYVIIHFNEFFRCIGTSSSMASLPNQIEDDESILIPKEVRQSKTIL